MEIDKIQPIDYENFENGRDVTRPENIEPMRNIKTMVLRETFKL